ncbi:MAG: hypothetical protein KKD77_24595 [Gammaproteobacteria bacterium]|nr:hypothetical protein [Gammaproteobacteria bacterium]MBU2685931.1 hypothetical protein [Gammaproteobacteria bacterium]
MPFIDARTQMGFKLEDTPYTAETLTYANYDFRIKNISCTPELEEAVMKYATQGYGAFRSLIGKKLCTISGTIDLNAHGTATSDPEWSDLIRSCGFTKSTLGAGVAWDMDADASGTPATIELQYVSHDGGDAVVVKLAGCMGNISRIGFENVGNCISADIEWQGILKSVTDRAEPFIAQGWDDTDPSPVTAATVETHSEAQDVNSLAVNIGNQVSVYTDPAKIEGARGAYVVNADPTVTLDPYLDKISERGDFARWSAGTTGSFLVEAGSGASKISLIANSFQITGAYGKGERDGLSTNAKTGRLLGEGTDHVFRICQGTNS